LLMIATAGRILSLQDNQPSRRPAGNDAEKRIYDWMEYDTVSKVFAPCAGTNRGWGYVIPPSTLGNVPKMLGARSD